jgi:hypothetical protein
LLTASCGLKICAYNKGKVWLGAKDMDIVLCAGNDGVMVVTYAWILHGMDGIGIGQIDVVSIDVDGNALSDEFMDVFHQAW